MDYIYTICAHNIKTDEKRYVGEFDCLHDAEHALIFNIEYDEDDNPEDYRFSLLKECVQMSHSCEILIEGLKVVR